MLTAAEKSLRDAWLAEMWKPCPEWQPSKDERLDARARNDELADRYGDDGHQLMAV